jgi:adenylate cyclase
MITDGTWGRAGGAMLTFRTSITFAVMAFVGALAAILTLIQFKTFHLATEEAASAYMDAASSKAFGRLQTQVAEIASLVRVLSSSSTLADSDEKTEIDRGIALFTVALRQLPQADSIYVGYGNGSFLQVRSVAGLNDEQRTTLRTPTTAAIAISLIRPTADGWLPMRRIFEDQQGNQIAQQDLWNYDYDARKRRWYLEPLEADQLVISSPYMSFSIGTPVITVSAPLRGTVRGVIAADLKLDSFSDFVNAQRPGARGTAVIFDSAGAVIAHPDFAQFVASAQTHPGRPQLPNIRDIKDGLVAAVLKGWTGQDQYNGSIEGEGGLDYFFRVQRFGLNEKSGGVMLTLAAQDDFAADVRKWQFIALILAMIASAAFIPGVWIFGSRMSRSLKSITAQAAKLQTLAAPDRAPVDSYVKEIRELGLTVNLAQRAISSFARFVPKEIVRRVVDNSISTELGGIRQEITIVFTDVQGFTTIAESADADALMRQTSRYFTALTDAFLAEGGTVDKFIGDAVMVFWNAPVPQPDHVERACRAALAGRKVIEQLNAQFRAEGLQPFHTRFGIHVGEAVVGNLGSAERMNYTALGSPVNLASRLEGLNKEYGTTIIASEDVYARVQHRFQFRALASVIAKGMTQETRIYELVEGAL